MLDALRVEPDASPGLPRMLDPVTSIPPVEAALLSPCLPTRAPPLDIDGPQQVRILLFDSCKCGHSFDMILHPPKELRVSDPKILRALDLTEQFGLSFYGPRLLPRRRGLISRGSRRLLGRSCLAVQRAVDRGVVPTALVGVVIHWSYSRAGG